MKSNEVCIKTRSPQPRFQYKARSLSTQLLNELLSPGKQLDFVQFILFKNSTNSSNPQKCLLPTYVYIW